MTRLFLGVIVCFATICGLLIGLGAAVMYFAMPAHAQDSRAEHDAGHMKYHPAYSTWAVPGGYPGSCCNMRIRQADGSMTGDCYPTQFEPVVVDGKFDHWRALLDDYDGGQWIDVPDDRVIREKNPDPSGISGHLCYGHEAKVVYCAVPPAGTL